MLEQQCAWWQSAATLRRSANSLHHAGASKPAINNNTVVCTKGNLLREVKLVN
jgi:hypothetical protein